MGKRNEAVYQLREPLVGEEEKLLKFRIGQQYGDHILLGAFRLSVSTALPPVTASPAPEEVANLLRIPHEERTADDRRSLAVYYRSIHPGTAGIREQMVELRRQQRGILQRQETEIEWIGGHGGISSFGINPSNGEILMADLIGGFIRRLSPPSDSQGEPYPLRLSETGIFSNLDQLTPHPGIVPFEVNAPFWSDHAEKRRWFSVPELSAKIGFSPDGNWEFPWGTLWIKHFDLEQIRGAPETARRLETRILMRNPNGVHGATYRWDEAGKEAHLVPEAGMDEIIPVEANGISISQLWRYPGRGECLQCHTPIAGHALAFNTVQLNRERLGSDWGGNQIAALSEAGYFQTALSGIHALPALAPIEDETVSREYRVRSYLHANCISCHQPGGTARGSWDASISIPTSEAGLIDGPILNSMDRRPGARIVRPGHPGDSLLLERIAGSSDRHMPPLATHELNEQAIALLRAWIEEDLAGFETFPQWQLRHFNSTTAPFSLPHADPDGDGIRNEVEYLTGGNPLDPSDSWRVVLEPHDDGVRIRFPVRANLFYQLQWTSNLLDPDGWLPLDVPGNRPFFSAQDYEARLEDLHEKAPARFYRLHLVQP
jgi:hypothetical protein